MKSIDEKVTNKKKCPMIFPSLTNASGRPKCLNILFYVFFSVLLLFFLRSLSHLLLSEIFPTIHIVLWLNSPLRARACQLVLASCPFVIKWNLSYYTYSPLSLHIIVLSILRYFPFHVVYFRNKEKNIYTYISFRKWCSWSSWLSKFYSFRWCIFWVIVQHHNLGRLGF